MADPPTPPVEVRDLHDLEGFPDSSPPAGAAVVGLLFHGEPAASGWWRVEGAVARAGLVVARAHRGLGLGKMLLGALETRARASGAREVRVAPGDAVAEWMLRRAGYEKAPDAWRKTY